MEAELIGPSRVRRANTDSEGKVRQQSFGVERKLRGEKREVRKSADEEGTLR
jgi:hypothetical protein